MSVIVLLLVSATPALAEDWVSFSMGEGPDLQVDRSSIRQDTEGAIAPWGKGWMTAKTMTKQGSHASRGYFVTDCGDLYYELPVNAQTDAIEGEGAQPLRVSPGAVAQRIQNLVCGKVK